MPPIVPRKVRMIAPSSARGAAGRVMPLLVLLGIGLALGACSKCDIPTWPGLSSGAAPLSCHDTPKPQ